MYWAKETAGRYENHSVLGFGAPYISSYSTLQGNEYIHMKLRYWWSFQRGDKIVWLLSNANKCYRKCLTLRTEMAIQILCWEGNS